MLIGTIQELEAIYPTSRWDNIDTLLPLFQKCERTKLVKYLGFPLLKLLQQQYADIVDEEGGITTLQISDPEIYDEDMDSAEIDDVEPGQMDNEEPVITSLTIDLIRACQEIIVYITLSNNVRILTSSLNQGGGFNMMETADYDQSSESQLKALKDELWNNAMDSLDALLIMLEEDAKSAKRYTKLWQESNYYYLHSDLIFRTADELSHYLPLDGGRAAYIRLTPGLRNAQNQYIETRIGSALVQRLCSPLPVEDATGLFDVFARHVRIALANYTNIELLRLKGTSDKNSTQSRARSEMQNDYHEYGDREMGLALDVLFNNPSVFASEISASGVLQYEYGRKMGQSWQTYLGSLEPAPEPEVPVGGCSCECSGASERMEHDGLFDLGGWHLL